MKNTPNFSASDLYGFVLSFALIGICYLVSLVVRKSNREIARKIVHIGVSNWIFICKYFFTYVLWPVLGLLFFAMFNFVYELRRKEGRRSWGTVEFPLVIIALLLAEVFLVHNIRALEVAVLVLGWGDGLAAVAGQKRHAVKLPYSKNKTWAGSLVMFAVSFVITFIFCILYKDLSVLSCIWSIVIALLASVTEAYTPSSLDNITVPAVVYVLEVLRV